MSQELSKFNKIFNNLTDTSFKSDTDDKNNENSNNENSNNDEQETQNSSITDSSSCEDEIHIMEYEKNIN